MSTNLASILGGAFNPADVVEATAPSFEVLPAGDYTVTITASEIKPTNNGDGQMLNLKLVTEKGRVVFDGMCVLHKSIVAQNIAQTKLKQITTSLGLKQVSDTKVLHDKPLIAHIIVEVDKYQSDKQGTKVFRNTVKGYSPLPSTVSAAVANDVMSDDIPF